LELLVLSLETLPQLLALRAVGAAEAPLALLQLLALLTLACLQLARFALLLKFPGSFGDALVGRQLSRWRPPTLLLRLQLLRLGSLLALQGQPSGPCVLADAGR
jgi:hypothetical protein